MNEQIKYHHHVLGSQGPKKLFQKTHGGKVLNAEQLKTNLEEILRVNESRAGNVAVFAETSLLTLEDTRFTDLKKRITGKADSTSGVPKSRQGETKAPKILKRSNSLN